MEGEARGKVFGSEVHLWQCRRPSSCGVIAQMPWGARPRMLPVSGEGVAPALGWMRSLKYSPVVFPRGTLVASAVLLPVSEDGALERGASQDTRMESGPAGSRSAPSGEILMVSTASSSDFCFTGNQELRRYLTHFWNHCAGSTNQVSVFNPGSTRA